MKTRAAKSTSQRRKTHVTGVVLGLEEEALQSAGDLFRVVADGVSVDRFRKLADFGVPAAALEAIIPRRTLTHRTQNGQSLNLGESTSAAYTALMLSEAIDTFGNREVALEWLGAPKVFLDGKAPFEMLNNIPAIQEVRNKIGQIDSGYFA